MKELEDVLLETNKQLDQAKEIMRNQKNELRVLKTTIKSNTSNVSRSMINSLKSDFRPNFIDSNQTLRNSELLVKIESFSLNEKQLKYNIERL